MTTESALWEWAKSQGPVVLILVTLLVFGYKQFIKFAAKQGAETRAAWDAKEKVSDERFADMKDRLNASDRRHDDCEKSKQIISHQLFQLACMTGNTSVLEPKPIKSPDDKTTPSC